ncbi:hypothetical protein [Paenibacillus eucommiae]|uniref:Uncharacterized protein n=1 Tax=Paenibacillus eucommiae TaxID=1355755 RepID=A0ABS4J5R9_9BACL|nr:hypothetical protein [Paenibacillus eucommiae]MBP1994630.1 hypothetical protein [Paenibacillus eucommiae]
MELGISWHYYLTLVAALFRMSSFSAALREKPFAGCPFELGVRAIRPIVAREREGMWAEELVQNQVFISIFVQSGGGAVYMIKNFF